MKKNSLLALSLFILGACWQPEEKPQQPSNNTGDTSSDASTDAIGTSTDDVKETPHSIRLMNWNILVNNENQTSSVIIDGTTHTYTADYVYWGGASPVAPRAKAMAEGLTGMDVKPAFITVMEMDPSWKIPENFHQIEELGYKMLYPNTPFMLTQILYKPERFTLIEKDYINFSKHQGMFGAAMKTSVTYGVFQEKETNEIFIGLSTHWEPNGGTNMDNGISGALNNIYYCEEVRMQQAKESIELLNKLRGKYPMAHFFYGGDLNTVDFDLLFAAFAEFFAPLDTSDMTIASLFMLTGSTSITIADNYPGAVGYFHENSGLLGGRRQAKAQGLAFDDISSTQDAALVKDYIGMELTTPIIIDYNFFSPEMKLTKYQIFGGEPFATVSDHLPVSLDLEYFPRNSGAPLNPLTYPDDSGTDLYLPIASYQGRQISFPTDN